MPRAANFSWLIALFAGCTVVVMPAAPWEGDLAAQTAREIVRLRREKPEPSPEPKPGECCKRCENGWITHGDGHRTPCPCPPTCECKRASEQ
jgi:hypothetical protein